MCHQSLISLSQTTFSFDIGTEKMPPYQFGHARLVSYSQKHQGKAVLSIHIRSSKRYFSHPSLITRQSALLLKVGVLYGLRSI